MLIKGLICTNHLTIKSLILYYRISEPEGKFANVRFGIKNLVRR